MENKDPVDSRMSRDYLQNVKLIQNSWITSKIFSITSQLVRKLDPKNCKILLLCCSSEEHYFLSKHDSYISPI
jgi:hypothetical protein